MNFNKHSELIGSHAFLGPSKYHWVNYDTEKLVESYSKFCAIERGVKLHEFAKKCIELGIKLPKSTKSLNQYINDAIGFRMTPELVLFYSPNAFGTVDSISFKKNVLRIHDLKTGVTPASMRQLEIYAALFFLEYDEKPSQVSMELRLYQNDEIMVLVPEPSEIQMIMDKIILFDKKISELRLEDDLWTT